MKLIGIKMSDDAREAISSLFYIVPPKKHKGNSINIYIDDAVDVKISIIADRHKKYTGKRGRPQTNKSKVIEIILNVFSIAWRQGKFGDKDMKKVLEEAKSITAELHDKYGMNIKVTKSVFVSALVRHICRQKLPEHIFKNLNK